jgi:hypothetical protein
VKESRVLLVAGALACPLVLAGIGSSAVVSGAGAVASGVPACHWSITTLSGPAAAEAKPPSGYVRGNPVLCDHHSTVTGGPVGAKAGQRIRICNC